MGPTGHDHLYKPSPEELRAIRTTPGTTSNGQPFDHHVRKKVERGEWRLECIRPDVLGLARPLEIYRGIRQGNFITPWQRSDDAEAYCPAHWADLKIGSGACGLRCRGCFLVLTHRVFCDPSRHLLYENLDEFESAVIRWLRKPDRKNLGLGIDCSDSLLYEGVIGHARRLIPLFADQAANPHGAKLILLTKSVNVQYLKGLPRRNVIVSFSLNPEKVADLWEGKFADGTRVTPPITERLGASLRAQEMGFEVRWRIDPILPLDDWVDVYRAFLDAAAGDGHRPTRVTLGTYRQTQPSLATFVSRWGLPPLEWERPPLVKDGAHLHLDRERRVEIYRQLLVLIRDAWKATCQVPTVALCKEPRSLREAIGLAHDRCNCG
jgi:hypothetical protein